MSQNGGRSEEPPPPLLYACAYALTMPYTLNIAGTRTGCRFQQRTFQQVLLACPVLNMNHAVHYYAGCSLNIFFSKNLSLATSKALL